MKKDFDLNSVPILKPTVQRNDSERAIYLRTSGRITEIDNNTVYSKIVNLLDGKNTLEDIINILTKEFPQESILNAFKEFNDLRLLENLNLDKTILSSEEQKRWARNLNFLGSYCNYSENKQALQAKLRDCKITLLGLGGLGSHILFDLAALGCKDIVAVEFDNVEISNLNRQILYTPNDIGKPKAEIAKKRILEFSPDLKLEIINKRISGIDDVHEAIRGRDILICVADRPKTEIMHWVNAACVKEKIPLITGGLDTQKARFYSVFPDNGCLQCWRDFVKNVDNNIHEILELQQKTELRGDNAAFVPFVALIAGYIVAELVKAVTNIGVVSSKNKVHEIDFYDLSMKITETWDKNNHCFICG